MRFLSGFIVAILLFASSASAHPGRLDSAGGHVVTKRFTYEDEEVSPSEIGEYHFHKFVYPQEEFQNHVVGKNEKDQLILECEKKNGEKVRGIMRFRRD